MLLLAGYVLGQLLGSPLAYAAWAVDLRVRALLHHDRFVMLPPTVSVLALATLLGFLLSALWAFLYVRHQAHPLLRRSDVEGIAWRAPRPHAYRAAVVVAAMAMAFAVLMVAAVPPDVHKASGPLARLLSAPGLPRFVVMAIAVAGAPLVEEFVFRGALFAGLVRRLGVPMTAVITTAVFAGLHLQDKRGWWPGFLVVGFLGLLLVVLRVRYRSLWPGMLAHFLYNVSFFLMP